MFWTKFKFIGHSVKNLSPSQKTLRPPWCPKLVMGLPVLRDLNHYWNVKWTMKHSLCRWHHIIKFIIIACFVQYIHSLLHHRQGRIYQ